MQIYHIKDTVKCYRVELVHCTIKHASEPSCSERPDLVFQFLKHLMNM